MHGVIRSYTGSGASELFKLLESNQKEIEEIISEVSGFVSYTMLRSDDGGSTVTVCKDKTGTDESVKVAKDWIIENAPDIKVSAPLITEGSVVIHLR